MPKLTGTQAGFGLGLECIIWLGVWLGGCLSGPNPQIFPTGPSVGIVLTDLLTYLFVFFSQLVCKCTRYPFLLSDTFHQTLYWTLKQTVKQFRQTTTGQDKAGFHRPPKICKCASNTCGQVLEFCGHL